MAGYTSTTPGAAGSVAATTRWDDPMDKFEPAPNRLPRPTPEERQSEGRLAILTAEGSQAHRLAGMVQEMADEMIAMRDALLWYADPENYDRRMDITAGPMHWAPSTVDAGGRARSALGIVYSAIFQRTRELEEAVARKHSEPDTEVPFAGEIKHPKGR